MIYFIRASAYSSMRVNEVVSKDNNFFLISRPAVNLKVGSVWFSCMLIHMQTLPLHLYWSFHSPFIVGVNGAWYNPHEPVHFIILAINKEKQALQRVPSNYSTPELHSMYGQHGSAKEIPSLLKTVKIKQAKPYYGSLQEHCWVSREQETGVERKREREITLVRVWPSQCGQKWKAWNWIPTFLWLYDRPVRNAAALHMSFHTTSPPPAVLQFTSSSEDDCMLDFSQGCIFGPPTLLLQQLAQSKVSLPPSVPRMPPWAAGKVPTTC